MDYTEKREELFQSFLASITEGQELTPKMMLFIENSYKVGFNDCLEWKMSERISEIKNRLHAV